MSSVVALLVATLAGAPAATASTSPAPAPAGLKPQVAGVLNLNGPTVPIAFRSMVNSVVVMADWAQLQPTRGGPISRGNAIDRALAEVRAANNANPGGNQRIKIRLFTGIRSPEWAKHLGGAPVYVQETTGVRLQAGTIPRFWTPAAGAAYAELWRKLAARYDSAPEIGEIALARCMTVFAEPLIRQTNDRVTVRNLLAAGYSDVLDDRCQREQIDLAKAWPHTRVSMSFSPYQRINADGGKKKDVAYALELMNYCRRQLGAQCVLENNELGKAYNQRAGERMGEIYAHMRRLGGPMSFQMCTPEKAIDPSYAGFLRSLREAVAVGGGAVELYPTYRSMRPADLLPYDRQLEAQAAR